jgi:hypothetical protein
LSLPEFADGVDAASGVIAENFDLPVDVDQFRSACAQFLR